MSTGTCPRCGKPCEIAFRRYITRNGKIIYPKKAKVFPIPQCDCC